MKNTETLVAEWRRLAATLRSEVERGVAIRQSAESKLARAEVLESCAESVASAVQELAPDRVVAAWLLDRAEQYENDSAVRALFDELMLDAAKGAHRAAFAHGELDDLMQCPFIRDSGGGS